MTEDRAQIVEISVKLGDRTVHFNMEEAEDVYECLKKLFDRTPITPYFPPEPYPFNPWRPNDIIYGNPTRTTITTSPENSGGWSAVEVADGMKEFANLCPPLETTIYGATMLDQINGGNLFEKGEEFVPVKLAKGETIYGP